jgi:hypothetical protein
MRAPPLVPSSESESQHELKLPSQTGTHIVSEEGVVVVVMAVNRIDLSKGATPRRRACKWSRGVAVEVEG